MSGRAAPRERVVTVQASALETITTEVFGSAPDLETGGILLGHAPGDRADLHVTVAGDPGPNAVHEPRRFLRDPAHAQTLADRAWADHQAVWISEWHTHPAAGPMPSEIDLQSYLQHLEDPELQFTEFLSLIVASTDAGPAVAAWIVTSTHLIEASLSVTDVSLTGDHPDQPPPDEPSDGRVHDKESP